jgi:hypothetical protein
VYYFASLRNALAALKMDENLERLEQAENYH